MILINGRFLTQPLAGIGRFSLEMCKALRKEGMLIRLLVPKKYKRKITDTYGFDIIYFGAFDSHLWEQFSVPFFLHKHKRPLLLNFSGLGPVFYSNKVITIHDVSYLYNPAWFSKKYYVLYKYLTPVASRYARFVITVSEFSKQEIVKYLSVEEEKIIVLHNATEFHLCKNIIPERKYGKYILGVFSLDPRKNFQLLIEAFLQLGLADHKLLLVGKKFDVFNFYGLDLPTDDQIIFTGYVTDEELLSLYAGCSLFVYPSLYEGFGIPPLEALAMKKKVLVSDIPVFREVFGDAVFYFRSNSVASLTENMRRLIGGELRIKSDSRTSILMRYSWSQSAKLLITKLENYE